MSTLDTSHILIVEDEQKISQLLADYFGQAGFSTHQIYRGDQVMDYIFQAKCDLILLDLMLPGIDGLQLCKMIRDKSNVPIIMVTARVEEIDRLLGLELGADDYVCKPFSPREVVARTKAVLRRTQLNKSEFNNTQHNNGQQSDAEQTVSDNEKNSVILDEQRFQVENHSKRCELTKVEFYLFKTLMQNPGRIYSRNQLMDLIYDDGHSVSDRTIDSHVKKLRKKLDGIGIEASSIYSVYGVGYKYE